MPKQRSHWRDNFWIVLATIIAALVLAWAIYYAFIDDPEIQTETYFLNSNYI